MRKQSGKLGKHDRTWEPLAPTTISTFKSLFISLSLQEICQSSTTAQAVLKLETRQQNFRFFHIGSLECLIRIAFD